MGLSLSRGRHAILVVLCIPFFCSTRAASILPSRPHISIAVARSDGQGRRFFSAAEGLSLTGASRSIATVLSHLAPVSSTAGARRQEQRRSPANSPGSSRRPPPTSRYSPAIACVPWYVG